MIIGCEMPSDKPGSFFKPVIVTLPAPDKPFVTAADTFITVKWNAMEGVTQYEVYCGLESSPPAQPSATVTERVCILTDLTNKRPYFIWIKAVYGNKKSDFSERARAVPWPSGEAPERPSNIVVKSGIDSLALVWDASGGAERYQIYLSTSIVPGGTPLYETSETAFVIPGLQNEVIYYLWLKAHNAGGESAFSDMKPGVPKTPAAPPAAPGKPVLTPLSGRILVSVGGAVEQYEPRAQIRRCGGRRASI